MGALLHLIRDRKPLPDSIRPEPDHDRAAAHYGAMLAELKAGEAARERRLAHQQNSEAKSARDAATLRSKRLQADLNRRP